ncbi:HNH endonuclease [Streptomyces phage phiRKBJ001]|nr:HNH endonuclease [Streptomyces phage phiRKBJ001]
MARKGVAKNRRKLVVRDGLICQGCKEEFPNEELTVDHIRPLSKGGHPKALGNLQLMCEPCNTAKSDNWDEKSGLGIDDCNRRMMTIEEQARECLEKAMDDVAVAVLESRGTLSMPELVAIGAAAAIGSLPNVYVGNLDLAERIRSEKGPADMFGKALYKNDIRISGE